MAAITVIGEAVADAVTTSPPDGTGLQLHVRPGGSPANTAVGLARLGDDVRFAGRLSSGILGRLLHDHLLAAGVDLRTSVTAPGEAALAIAAVDEQAKASYDFYLSSAVDWGWRDKELHIDADSVAIHTGSLALVMSPSDTAIATEVRKHRGHATVSIDPNARPGAIPAADYRARFSDWLGLADIVKVSDDDLDYIFPGADHPQLCRQWHESGVGLVVVTRGSRGATAYLPGHADIQLAAPTVTVVDTIGAGDAFSAGLLHELGAQQQLGGRCTQLAAPQVYSAMQTAATLAARACQVAGADPSSPADGLVS